MTPPDHLGRIVEGLLRIIIKYELSYKKDVDNGIGFHTCHDIDITSSNEESYLKQKIINYKWKSI